MGARFPDEVVAAAFDVAALPPGPLRIHEQVMTDEQRGESASDRPCVGCCDTGRIAFGSIEDGTPPTSRPCPVCCPTPADVKAHEAAVAEYGEDYF